MFKFLYKVKLTQLGENHPKLSKLNEGILGTSWSRSAPGTYHFRRDRSFYKLNESFPSNAVVEILPNGDKITIARTDRNEFTLQSFHSSDLDTPVDGVLNKYKFVLKISREDMRL